MINNAELIDLAETEFDFLVNKAHKSGLSYWEILRIVIALANLIFMQDEAERFLRRIK